MQFLGGHNLAKGSETLYMTSEVFGEVFEGDCADMCEEFQLVSMVGKADLSSVFRR